MAHPWLSLLILSAQVISAANTALVKTSNGTVQGARCPTTDSNQFLGIPFADPPVGNLRFRAPQPYSGSYNGTLNGTYPAPICHQFGSADTEIASEDCLYLNVYAPANATSSTSLPVKLWIYGGAFVTGASSLPLYDGCFASNDAIIVTVNYRLGPLGFLALQNTTLTSNNGILDQLQALRWVRDNIAAFGGNADEILLFGQSAGAISSFLIATLPEAKSLIKAVVMESGGGVDIPTTTSVQTFQTDFVHLLNCTTTNLDCLQSKTATQLQATYNQSLVAADRVSFAFTLLDRNGSEFGFGPVTESPLFPVQPSQVGVQVPALFGSNGLEGSIFVLEAFGAAAKTLNSTIYTDFLKVNFGPFATTVGKKYPLSLFDNSVFEAMSIVTRDYLFRCTAYRGLSRATEKNLGAWTYSFNQTLTCPFVSQIPTDDLQLLGACHEAEIIFVFGEVDNLPQPNGNCSLSSGEKNISTYMQQSWTNMARNAEPGNGWPNFSPDSSMGVNFQNGLITPGVVDYSMCGFWDKLEVALLNATQPGISTTYPPAAAVSSSGAASITHGSVMYALGAIVSLLLCMV